MDVPKWWPSGKCFRSDERGFTLIELLVVILVLGMLAAIALPIFLSQRGKGQDARAKASVRAAFEAEEDYFVENGRYTVDVNDLYAIDPSLRGAAVGTSGPYDNNVMEVYARSESGRYFFIQRNVDRSIDRYCPYPGQGGCPASSFW